MPLHSSATNHPDCADSFKTGEESSSDSDQVIEIEREEVQFKSHETNVQNDYLITALKCVMDQFPPFSYERRAIAQTCKALREYGKMRFIFIQGQIGSVVEEDSWLSLEQYHEILSHLDLGGSQNVTENSIITATMVRTKIEKIKIRQAFEMHFFRTSYGLMLEGSNMNAVVDKNTQVEFRAKIMEKREDIEHPLVDLEQTHNLLNKINAQIIDKLINFNPSASALDTFAFPLTRFPDCAVLLNLSFFQKLKALFFRKAEILALPESIGELQSLEWLSCSKAKLESLPESLGRLQALKYLVCSDNFLYTLPESIGQLHSLRTLSCSRNFLQALPAGLERFQLGEQEPRPNSLVFSSNQENDNYKLKWQRLRKRAPEQTDSCDEGSPGLKRPRRD